MTPFKNISSEENEALLKFPAYISLLAANADNFLDEAERISAINFSHTKTFSCDPLLTEFYDEADKVFARNIEQLDKELPKEKDKREIAIKGELQNLQSIAQKLGEEYDFVMLHSMETFKEHVSKAHHNILIDFILPVHIANLPGI